jgi:hypothetical protein
MNCCADSATIETNDPPQDKCAHDNATLISPPPVVGREERMGRIFLRMLFLCDGLQMARSGACL